MYAPKFRSWMTDWERFDEALDARLDAMADSAMTEIRAMVESAMSPEPVVPKSQSYMDLVNALQPMLNSQAAQYDAMRNIYPAGAYSGHGIWDSLGLANAQAKGFYRP